MQLEIVIFYTEILTGKVSKKKNKPSSVPVGFLNILSVPDPSGNYLVYATDIFRINKKNLTYK